MTQIGSNWNKGAAYVFTTPSPPTLTVPVTDWTSAGLTLTLGGDGNLHVYTTGTTTDVVPPCPPASVTNIAITSPSSTTANLTIDSTNGDPIPAGGLDYSGAGGLIITGSGTVNLSGTNIYTGGTTISAGTLLITNASTLPGGTSLTVGAGGTFIFDPTSTGASSVTSATPATAVTAKVVSSSRVPPYGQPTNNPSKFVLFASPKPSPPAPLPKGEGRLERSPSAQLPKEENRCFGDLAWLGQAVNSSDNSDQQRKAEVATLAREAAFAGYGQ